MNLNNNFFEPA